ncbi:hypothetical protein BDR04DRAFT_1149916 [Suillus decipiens]|nr:hypothetical protein BDR04DRAFT_1149916 [Suillus decipiens]
MPNHNHIKYMHSLKNCTDKARQLQDKPIKADHNLFLMWDQWENLPAGFKYSTHPEHSLPTHTCNNHMKKSAPSTMPVSKASATAIAKKHFSKEVFDMCWSTEAEPVPSVETLTASSLAKPPYSSQMFEMCWDIEPYPAPMVNAPVNAPAEASSAKRDLGGEEFNMCWETDTTPPKVLVPAITVEAAMPPAAAPYDFCWDEAPQSTMANSSHIPTPSAAGHLTAKPTTGSVNSAADNQESSESQDTWASLTPSSALTEGSAMAKLEAGEELLLQANERLQRLDMMMRDNTSPAATGLVEANQGLINKYQIACNQYVAAANDIAKIQHLLQMFRQIEDPLTVLELGIKKAGG